MSKFNTNEFVENVMERNIHLMTKTDWEMNFFYCYVKANYLDDESSLYNLDNKKIGRISDDLHITYKQTSALINRCYPLEKGSVDNSFTNLVNSVITNRNFEVTKDGIISFEVVNPLMLEKINRSIRDLGYLRDTSFNRNIVTLSTDAFLAIIGVKPDTVFKYIVNNGKAVVDACKDIAGKESPDATAVKKMVNAISALRGKHIASETVKILAKGFDSVSPLDCVKSIIEIVRPKSETD